VHVIGFLDLLPFLYTKFFILFKVPDSSRPLPIIIGHHKWMIPCCFRLLKNWAEEELRWNVYRNYKKFWVSSSKEGEINMDICPKFTHQSPNHYNLMPKNFSNSTSTTYFISKKLIHINEYTCIYYLSWIRETQKQQKLFFMMKILLMYASINKEKAW